MGILESLVGCVVRLELRTALKSPYVVHECKIWSVDAEWVGYIIPGEDKECVRRESILSIKIRGSHE